MNIEKIKKVVCLDCDKYLEYNGRSACFEFLRPIDKCCIICCRKMRETFGWCDSFDSSIGHCETCEFGKMEKDKFVCELNDCFYDGTVRCRWYLDKSFLESL